MYRILLFFYFFFFIFTCTPDVSGLLFRGVCRVQVDTVNSLSRVYSRLTRFRDYIGLFACNQYLFLLRARALSDAIRRRSDALVRSAHRCSTCKLNNLVARSAAISVDISVRALPHRRIDKLDKATAGTLNYVDPHREKGKRYNFSLCSAHYLHRQLNYDVTSFLIISESRGKDACETVAKNEFHNFHVAFDLLKILKLLERRRFKCLKDYYTARITKAMEYIKHILSRYAHTSILSYTYNISDINFFYRVIFNKL